MRTRDTIFTVVGAAVLAGGVYGFIASMSFVNRARTARGTVVLNTQEFDIESGTMHRPIVAFTTPAGETVEFTASGRSNSPHYFPGDVVTVLYEPGHESQAVIKSFSGLWALPTVAAVIGVFFLAFGTDARWRGKQAVREARAGTSGRWYRLVYRSRKIERVEQVLATLREAQIPIFVEEQDAAGAVQAPSPGSPLKTGCRWSVFVPEHTARSARDSIRKLTFRIMTDPDGRGARRSEAREFLQVIVWSTVFCASVIALIFAIQVWRGVFSVRWDQVWSVLFGLCALATIMILPIHLASRDARKWLKASHRRFIATAQGLTSSSAPLS